MHCSFTKENNWRHNKKSLYCIALMFGKNAELTCVTHKMWNWKAQLRRQITQCNVHSKISWAACMWVIQNWSFVAEWQHRMHSASWNPCARRTLCQKSKCQLSQYQPALGHDSISHIQHVPAHSGVANYYSLRGEQSQQPPLIQIISKKNSFLFWISVHWAQEYKIRRGQQAYFLF